MEVLKAAPTRAGGDSADALMVIWYVDTVIWLVFSRPPLVLGCCSFSPSPGRWRECQS